MSIATDSSYCDSCDFRAGSAVIWGDFIYRLQGGEEISLNRTFGWCHSCASVEPIEDLSDKPNEDLSDRDEVICGSWLATELNSFRKATFFERIRGRFKKRKDEN